MGKRVFSFSPRTSPCHLAAARSIGTSTLSIRSAVDLSNARGGRATLITMTSETWLEIPCATDAMQSDTPNTGLVTTPATPSPNEREGGKGGEKKRS